MELKGVNWNQAKLTYLVRRVKEPLHEIYVQWPVDCWLSNYNNAYDFLLAADRFLHPIYEEINPKPTEKVWMFSDAYKLFSAYSFPNKSDAMRFKLEFPG